MLHLQYSLCYNIIQLSPFVASDRSVAPPILPPSPPPFFPEPTIKLLLAEFPIDLIMRLTHPRSKVRPSAEPRLVAPTGIRHPLPEILRAPPTRIQPGEEPQERAHLALLLLRGLFGVCSGHGVEECPGGAAEDLDVGRTFIWDGGGGRWRGVCCRCGRSGWRVGGALRFGLLCQGAPGCGGGAEAASVTC